MFVSLFRASHARAARLLLRPRNGTFQWAGVVWVCLNCISVVLSRISPDTSDECCGREAAGIFLRPFHSLAARFLFRGAVGRAVVGRSWCECVVWYCLPLCLYLLFLL